MTPEEFLEGNILLIVILLSASAAISYYFTRWVFSVNESLRKQDRIIELLEQLAGTKTEAPKTEAPKTEAPKTE
jgi:hypothetical protein